MDNNNLNQKKPTIAENVICEVLSDGHIAVVAEKKRYDIVTQMIFNMRC